MSLNVDQIEKNRDIMSCAVFFSCKIISAWWYSLISIPKVRESIQF